MTLSNTYDTRLLRRGDRRGAGVQLLLLVLLGTAIGLGPAGWLTGLAFAVATWAVLTRALHRARPRPFGPANRVTLARATLVGGVTALVADSFVSPPPVTVLVALTAVALILDAVDGKVARRTGTSSALGARFDMEVDAFLILVLSVYVSTSLGAWVLLIGAMRYVFVAAARVLPWLRGPATSEHGPQDGGRPAGDRSSRGRRRDHPAPARVCSSPRGAGAARLVLRA